MYRQEHGRGSDGKEGVVYRCLDLIHWKFRRQIHGLHFHTQHAAAGRLNPHRTFVARRDLLKIDLNIPMGIFLPYLKVIHACRQVKQARVLGRLEDRGGCGMEQVAQRGVELSGGP